jgi:hypothetical protein
LARWTGCAQHADAKLTPRRQPSWATASREPARPNDVRGESQLKPKRLMRLACVKVGCAQRLGVSAWLFRQGRPGRFVTIGQSPWVTTGAPPHPRTTHWRSIQPRAWADPASVTLGELSRASGRHSDVHRRGVAAELLLTVLRGDVGHPGQLAVGCSQQTCRGRRTGRKFCARQPRIRGSAGKVDSSSSLPDRHLSDRPGKTASPVSTWPVRLAASGAPRIATSGAPAQKVPMGWAGRRRTPSPRGDR